jgi:alpha-L-rhamnosidase
MLNAINLRTEYLKNPIGIDIIKPRFSWTLDGESKKQLSYEVRASSSINELQQGVFNWESGLVESNQMTHISYGRKLSSREQVYWQVRICDEDGVFGNWSEIASFEMGLLNESDWKAQWICGDYEPLANERYPADEFKKEFSIEEVSKARLYITACGLYEVKINGIRVGNQVFTPGLTSYDKRIQYQVYDVAEYLKAGNNSIEITLGDGWFRGKSGVFGATQVYGKVTSLMAQLEVYSETGTINEIVTDETFLWSNDGPVRFNDMKDGETVLGNCIPSYTGKAKSININVPLSCSNNVPVIEQEHFMPEVIITPDGSTVLDFKQNIAGYMAFSVKGSKGHTVSMNMGEMLDANGNFTVSNLITIDTSQAHVPDYCDDSRFQSMVYTCGSDEREYWKPKFCFQGFRYVKLNNWPEEVNPEYFTAIAVYSDMDELIEFECSSKDINKLVENTLWSMKGNHLDVPTDCPQRERAAWTGDAQLFFETGAYFMDFSAFYRKWLQDIFDDQAEDGKIYNIVPRVSPHGGANDFVEGSSGWTDAGILIPYRYWKIYNDISIIKKYYEQMKHLIKFLLSRMGDTSDAELDKKLQNSEHRAYIVTTGFHFGEWCEPGGSPMDVMKPKYEEATAYLYFSLTLMSEMSDAIGRVEDAEEFTHIAKRVKEAYNFYFANNGVISSERMSRYVRPLAFGLIADENIEKISEEFIGLVRKNHHHIGTGFLSTPFILRTISEFGYLEDAYKMLEKEDYPSWIHEIRQGATTIWENWEGVASRNHYSNGAVCHWIFSTVCGVSIIGANLFKIAPRPGGSFTYAEIEYNSQYGKIYLKWEKQNEKFVYKIKIPAGCSAEIDLTDIQKRSIDAGEHTIIASVG